MSVDRRPLPVLLSNALVAYTIEFDNEFERRLIEPTGLTFKEWNKTPDRVFLVSLVMWANYLQFVPDGGITVRALAEHARRSRIDSVLNGFRRWRYVVVDPPGGKSEAPSSEWIVRPTRHLEWARDLWEGLAETIEARWRDRFGEAEVEELRRGLWEVVKTQDPRLPLYLPIVSSRDSDLAFSSHVTFPIAETPSREEDANAGLPLFALLARVLLSFTLELEAQCDVAAPVGANVLRVLSPDWVPIRDLPVMSGVSKEATAQVLTLLRNNEWSDSEPIPNERGKQVRLTDKGLKAQERYKKSVAIVTGRWESRPENRRMRNSLEEIVGGELASSRLSEGLIPPPPGWRASVPRPRTLPDHPMVLIRGGWPDGS